MSKNKSHGCLQSTQSLENMENTKYRLSFSYESFIVINCERYISNLKETI